MSTKIYNGYIYRGGNIFELVRKFEDIWNKSYIDARKNIALLIVNEFVACVDFGVDNFVSSIKHLDIPRTNCQLNKTTKLLFSCFDYISMRQEKVFKTQECDECYDFSMNFWLYPVSNGKILFLADCPQQMAFDLVNKEFDYYGYWNNADKPDDLPQRFWNKRARDWEVAFGLNKKSSLIWRNFDGILSYPYNPFRKEDMDTLLDYMIEFLPTKEKRAEDLARQEIVEREYKNGAKLNVTFFNSFDEKFGLEAKESAKNKIDGLITIDRELIKTHNVFLKDS